MRVITRDTSCSWHRNPSWLTSKPSFRVMEWPKARLEERRWETGGSSRSCAATMVAVLAVFGLKPKRRCAISWKPTAPRLRHEPLPPSSVRHPHGCPRPLAQQPYGPVSSPTIQRQQGVRDAGHRPLARPASHRDPHGSQHQYGRLVTHVAVQKAQGAQAVCP